MFLMTDEEHNAPHLMFFSDRYGRYMLAERECCRARNRYHVRG